MSLAGSPKGEAARCTRCGACLAVCPVYAMLRHERFSPRGRVQLALEGNKPKREYLTTSKGFQDAFAACLQCGACDSVCNASVNPSAVIRSVREKLPKKEGDWKGYLIDFLGSTEKSRLAETAFGVLSKIPRQSGIWQRLIAFSAQKTGRLMPLPASTSFLAKKSNEHGKQLKGGTVFFTGCVQNYLYPEIADKVDTFFEGTLIVPTEQGCCGLAAWSSGATSKAQEAVMRNLDILLACEPSAVMTACSSCAFMIKKWHEIFEVGSKEHRKALAIADMLIGFEEMAAVSQGSAYSALDSGQDIRIAYHASCHERFFLKDYNNRLDILRTITARDICLLGQCCGGGGFFSVSYSGLSKDIFLHNHADCGKNYDYILTSCSGCLLQMRSILQASKGSGLPSIPKVLHPVEILGRF